MAPSTRDYDGGTLSASLPVVTGLQGKTDTVTGLIQAYADRNAGPAKAMSVTGYTVNDGNSGANYSVTTVNDTGVINPLGVTLTAPSLSKIYDGNLLYATQGADLVALSKQLVLGDSVNAATFSFLNKNAGTSKSVALDQVTLSDGNSGGNYKITLAGNSTSTVVGAKITVQVNNTVVQDKMYDGNNTAILVSGIPMGILGNDVVTLTQAGTFATPNAGTGIAVTALDSLGGADAGNYDLVQPTGLSANITPAPLTITATAQTKVYDATLTASALPTVSGLIAGTTDTVLGLVQAYTNKNAGVRKNLSVAGYTVNDGNNGGNYTVTSVVAEGEITPAALTIMPSLNIRAYDATLSAAALPTVSGLQGLTDIVSGLMQAYTDKNAGANKRLNVTAYQVDDGNGGANYLISTPQSNSGEITKAPLSLSSTSFSKTFDDTTSAKGSVVLLSGALFSGDSLTGGSFAFDSSTAGKAKRVLTQGVTAGDGSNNDNYAITYVDNTSSSNSIIPRVLYLPELRCRALPQDAKYVRNKGALNAHTSPANKDVDVNCPETDPLLKQIRDQQLFSISNDGLARAPSPDSQALNTSDFQETKQ